MSASSQESYHSENATSTCSICIDRPLNAGIDGCKHRFCFRCIRKWSRQTNTCPMCRKTFRYLRYKQRMMPVPRRSRSIKMITETIQNWTTFSFVSFVLNSIAIQAHLTRVNADFQQLIARSRSPRNHDI